MAHKLLAMDWDIWWMNSTQCKGGWCDLEEYELYGLEFWILLWLLTNWKTLNWPFCFCLCFGPYWVVFRTYSWLCASLTSSLDSSRKCGCLWFTCPVSMVLAKWIIASSFWKWKLQIEQLLIGDEKTNLIIMQMLVPISDASLSGYQIHSYGQIFKWSMTQRRLRHPGFENF